MSPTNDETDSEERAGRGFFQRFGFVLGIAGVIAVVAVVFVGQSLFKKTPSVRRAPEVTMVRIVAAPLPPPPPPPPEQRLAQEKMIDQPLVDQSEPPPEAAPAASEIGTNLKGDGPSDGFGLSGNGNSGFVVGSRDPAGNATSNRWGRYAGQVQAAIGDALRRHPETRDASFRIVVRIWPDSAGRVRRAQLASSSGDLALDRIIKEDVLTGLQLREPPPEGMPFPIVMRLSARRPN